MKKLLLFILLGVGLYAQPHTDSNITKALSKNYSQLSTYSKLSDECYKNINTKKSDDLEECEGYDQIVRQIEQRIQRLEELRVRFYSK